MITYCKKNKEKIKSILVTSSLMNFFNSSYFIYVFGDVFSKSIDFIVLIFISLLISPSDYGYISIAYALIPIFLAFFTFNIPSSLIRRYYEDSDDYPEFLMSNFVFVSFNSIIFTLFIFIFSNYISLLIRIPPELLKITVLVVFFKGYFEFLRSYLQAVRESKKYSIVTFLYALFTNGILIILLVNMDKNQYLSKPIADLIVNSIFFFCILIFLLKIMKWKPKIEHIKYAVLFGAPLIIQVLANVILGQIDRFMINSLVGAPETGLYSFAYNLGMSMSIVILGINKGWLPLFYSNIENTKFLERKLNNITAIIFLIAAFLVTFGNLLLSIFINETYIESMSIFPVIVISHLFVYIYILFSNYSFYYKKTSNVSRNAFIAGITNIILNYILIQAFGYKIAATTTLISYIILCILHYFTAKKITSGNMISIRIFLRISIYFIIYISAIYFINKNVSVKAIVVLMDIFLLFIFSFIFYHRNKKKERINNGF